MARSITGKAGARRRTHNAERIIFGLRKSALRHRSSPRPGKRRVGLHKYLGDVYRIYMGLRSKRIAKRMTREIAKLAQIRVRKRMHPLRILIDASGGPEDVKQKSRWVQALKFVCGWKLPPEKVEWCFTENGGVYGCARKYAMLNRACRR